MSVKPWDMLDPNAGRVSKETLEERLESCRGCEHFIRLSGQCKKCLCFMKLKAQLPQAECPVGRWGKDEHNPPAED
jgi:hypothetical protein